MKLPHISFLNGKTTRDETHIVDIDETEIDSISLNNEIENFNNIFTKISEKLKIVNKDAYKDFFDKFHVLLKEEISNINNAVDNTVPNYIYATNVLSSKLKIFNYFNKKYLDLLEIKEPDSARILKQLFDNTAKSSELLTSIIYKLYPKINEKTNILRSQLEEALKTAQVVDKEIGGFEEKVRMATKERDMLLMQHQEEKDFLLEKIERLERENKQMTDQLLKNAKNLLNKSSNAPLSESGVNLNNNQYNNNNNLNQSQLQNNDFNKSKVGGSVIVGPSGSRVLTIKMMKDIINEIYISKVEFDKKCIENKMPKETMEQHMYYYLNQKYGLKTLIIEWASSIISGIKMYSSEDSEIYLFGKILRNELEEDSRFIFQKLKTTISDLLTYFLKSKNPLKANTEIKEMLNQKMNGNISQEEWSQIIDYVYEADDAKNLRNKLMELISTKKGFNNSQVNFKVESSNKKLTREEILKLSTAKEDNSVSYKDFSKVIYCSFYI